MHVPDHMLNGPICPVTAVVSTVGIATATYFALKSKEKPTALQLGGIGSLIFAAQMMNYPIQNGTSGHLIGSTLAVALLGWPFGVLVMTIVLLIQTLIFSDGGLTVLGANVLNMAIIGSICGGIAHKLFLQNEKIKPIIKYTSLGIASWLSVILAALACSLELSFAGVIPILKVLPAMLGIHALIGIGEALITIAVYMLLSSKKITDSKKTSFIIPLLMSGVIGLILSPFASGFPDGLEWIAEKYTFLHESTPAFTGLMPDYTIPIIKNEILSTALAGISGVIITFLIISIIGISIFLIHTNKFNKQ